MGAVRRRPIAAPELDFLGTTADLPRFLPEADAVIVSLPDNDATTGLIGAAQFALMKRGVLFVNLGRGPAVDEDAFHDALATGRIGAAGIDTWWLYPASPAARRTTLPSRHPLERYDNLVMSCHRATHVAGRETARIRDLAAILNAIAAGRAVNVVDRTVWY